MADEAEYIPADVYEREISAAQHESMRDLTPGVEQGLPREINRRRVVASFLDAFDMIGGVPALAEWGQGNRTEFYKLYSKMAPSASSDPGGSNTMVIKHVIPPSPLDE